jgi:tetraacyldisaccharide 4'-kinase
MYALVTQIRNYLFEKGIFKSSSFDFPIINVGNLAVGGSGKTPHIEYVVNLLKNNYKIATLSRGYGRTTKGFGEVLIDSKARDCGDEPLQIKQKFPDVRVFVGENRVEAVTKLLFQYPETEVILLDDAYQHRAINAGLNILLTDYAKIFTKDKSMPVGRLREKPDAAKRSDIVVVTKCPDIISEVERKQITDEIKEFTDSPVLFSKIEYDNLKAIGNKGVNTQNIDNVLLVSGLANPKPMEDFLKNKFSSCGIEHLSFKDHYKFTAKDIVAIKEKFNSFAGQNNILITSEKDAVRLFDFKEIKEIAAYILPIRISFLENDNIIFKEIIENYVRENKADYGVYKATD